MDLISLRNQLQRLKCFQTKVMNGGERSTCEQIDIVLLCRENGTRMTLEFSPPHPPQKKLSFTKALQMCVEMKAQAGGRPVQVFAG